MTTQEAAEYLGVTQSRIRQLILAGDITAVRRGRDKWVERAELERYQTVRPPRGRPAGRPRATPPQEEQ